MVSPHQSTADLETGSASKMSHRAYASALVLLVGLATCAGAAADDLAGRVVRIIDGDTLVLLVKEGGEERQEKIPPWTRLSTRPLRTARVPSAAAFGSIRTRCRRGSGGAGSILRAGVQIAPPTERRHAPARLPDPEAHPRHLDPGPRTAGPGRRSWRRAAAARLRQRRPSGGDAGGQRSRHRPEPHGSQGQLRAAGARRRTIRSRTATSSSSSSARLPRTARRSWRSSTARR